MMHINLTKIVLIIVIQVALSHALLAEDKVKLQLKWFSSFQFAGYYMAKEKGFYKEVGLDVEIIERDPSKNNIEQVIDGEAQYGVADSAILIYRALGKPVQVIASIFQHSPLIFLAKKESNIFSPFEMKGKVISYQKGIDDASLLSLLKSVNINESDYIYKPLDFSSQEFIDSKVDVISAYLSDQPFAMREKGIEVNIINPHNYGIDFYGDNLFTTDSEIENYPKRVKDFKKASLKGWKYALEHVDETIAILKKKYKAQSSTEHLKYEARITSNMIVPDMVEIGYTSKERFYAIAQIYQRIGKADKGELDRAVDTLIYNPQEPNKWAKYFYITISMLGLLAIILLALLYMNRRLKILVEKKTNELQQQNKELQNYILLVEEISITDGLTGIYNRRHFNDVLPKVINSAKRENELVNLIIMDIDYFKQYNDTYGHQMGDNVLIQVTKALKDSFHRADDYCFRLGGEEFGMIYKADTKEQSIEFANTIKEKIENLHIQHSKNSVSPYLTASFGLICCEAKNIHAAEEMYKQADHLLYKAKKSGRNRVCIF